MRPTFTADSEAPRDWHKSRLGNSARKGMKKVDCRGFFNRIASSRLFEGRLRELPESVRPPIVALVMTRQCSMPPARTGRWLRRDSAACRMNV